MPRWPYLSPDGQQKFVWLDDRSGRVVARLVAATRHPDSTRARAEELIGAIAVWPSSGVLAAHALSLSAVQIATQVIALGVMGTEDCWDLDLICNLAAEMRPLAAALEAAQLEAFDTVGLADRLPLFGEDCASTHAAVRTVLADVRSRAEPILATLGLLGDELPAVLAERARTKGDDLLETLHDQLASQYHESLVKQWDGWATVDRKLTAEVAGAARAGLIPAQGGGTLDQTRFDAAVDRVLRDLDEAQRQYLFSRWRSIASVARHIRVLEGQLPVLRSHKPEIDGLAKLSSEVLGHAADPKNDGAALLELLDVLRELKSLTAREEHLLATDRVPDLDADFAGRVRAVVKDTLPRLLREATMEVDRLSLLPPQRREPASAKSREGEPADKTPRDGALGGAARPADRSEISGGDVPAEEWAGAQISIPVQQADGTWPGEAFKDGPGDDNRWTGAPKPNLQEIMICRGTLDSGEWMLLQYVVPRKIEGRKENDSLIDRESRCCRRTPAQALHWFMQQALDPPPALVERVRQFSIEWNSFRASPTARDLLRSIIQQRFVNDDDPLLAGPARPDLELLRRLGLAREAGSGRSLRYSADAVAERQGVDGYVTWIDAHLARVGFTASLSHIGSSTPARTASETLKFTRPLTAPQACLDALTRAPRGIPNHEEIAKATGYAVPTIKEVMPVLADADHVEKRNGAWYITDKGRGHLKALRGE